MPEMDGFEAGEKILDLLKEANEEDFCHIVALTSYTSKDIQERVANIGFKDFINKPIKSVELQK
jgi:CheY-like chemotaxis protein